MANMNSVTKILLVEDDLKLARLITTYLTKYQFEVAHAEDGREGLQLVNSFSPELIILDLMMPKMDGLSVCRALQYSYPGSILVLTASDDDMEHVASLELGADDFVAKPIHPRVLLARIRALLRRKSITSEDTEAKEEKKILSFGCLTLNKTQRQAQLNGVAVELSESEFSLLFLLAENAETPLSRDEIMQATRGIEYNGLDRSIDNKVMSLRKKLGDSTGLPRRIITIRGKGYLFVSEAW